MAQNPRRSAFRMPWTSESEEPGADDATRADAPAEAASTPAAGAMGADAAPVGSPAMNGTEAGSAGPAAAPSGETPGVEAAQSSEFLRNLVDAMRSVAESSRDTSLAELRATVDARVEELRTAASEGADELRHRSELDIAAIGDWEKEETARVRAEAETKREARRAQLDQQLTEHQAASDRDVDATRRRLADHERDLATFFTQLAEINDPAAFVAAAKRMPRAPEIAPASAAPTTAAAEPGAPDPRLSAMGIGGGAVAEAATEPAAEPTAAEGAAAPDSELAERLAELDARLQGSAPGPEPVAPSAEPTAETSEPAAPAPTEEAPAPVAMAHAGSDTSTAIVVKGLGSFGAITSFKQALERVEGVRGVTLSLGPTGEFVYRASHGADFDLAAAIRTIEGDGATIDRSEGSLQVTVSRAR